MVAGTVAKLDGFRWRGAKGRREDDFAVTLISLLAKH